MNRLKRALILTHNRQELLNQCIEAIAPQVDKILVLDNASKPHAEVPPNVGRIYIPEQPPNLGNLWNYGFGFHTAGTDLAVLCDDAIVPDGWYKAVTEAMRETGAAIGAAYSWPDQGTKLKTEPDGDIMFRMPGWAWVVDMDKQPRADHRLHWWWVDTDMDWWARRNGGMVNIGGYPVPNMRPGEYTATVPGLGEQAGRDGEMFQQIHGWRPW